MLDSVDLRYLEDFLDFAEPLLINIEDVDVGKSVRNVLLQECEFELNPIVLVLVAHNGLIQLTLPLLYLRHLDQFLELLLLGLNSFFGFLGCLLGLSLYVNDGILGLLSFGLILYLWLTFSLSLTVYFRLIVRLSLTFPIFFILWRLFSLFLGHIILTG